MLPLSAPELRGNEWKYVKECLDTGWVSSVGPFVDRFEHEIAAYTGARHAIAVVNGTAGLHVALQLAGVQQEDEVLVSALTFIAPVNAIRYCGAHPVLIDADPQTWQIDAAKVERFLDQRCEMRSGACYNRRTGRRVAAIVPVHILGSACEIERLVSAAKQHRLRVVEDAAEAVGVRYRGRAPGTFGDIGVLSFNGNKIITCGGGGMVLTDDAALAAKARYLTTQAKDDGIEYIHNAVGYNYRLTNIQAALGLAQLEQLGPFIARKRAIARMYDAAFAEMPGMTPMPSPAYVEPTYWLYTVLLPPETTLDARRAAIARLHEQGIGARPLWHPINGLAPYQGCEAVEVEHAFRLYERAVSLPCGVDLEEADLRRVVETVRAIAEAGRCCSSSG